MTPAFVIADLFATKGIEYLFVIGFLLALILYLRLLSGSPSRSPLAAAARLAASPASWFQLRPGLFYHQGHGWASRGEDDVVTVGLDDFAQKLVGHPASLVLPSPGERLRQGHQGWGLSAGGRTVDMLSPVGGEVVEVNREVIDNPELVNEDPYGRGWLLKVHVPTWIADRMSLLKGGLARAWMDETVASLQGRLAAESGAIAQDGGAPVTGFARALSPDDWETIARDFLGTGTNN